MLGFRGVEDFPVKQDIFCGDLLTIAPEYIFAQGESIDSVIVGNFPVVYNAAIGTGDDLSDFRINTNKPHIHKSNHISARGICAVDLAERIRAGTEG